MAGAQMEDDAPRPFFPATRTVGKSFLNLKDGAAKEVGVEEVSSMGGDYRNMKQIAYKGGVSSRPPECDAYTPTVGSYRCADRCFTSLCCPLVPVECLHSSSRKVVRLWRNL